MQTKSRFRISATSGFSYDSPSMTWHQWHQTAPMSRRMGFFSSRARVNAASPQGSQWTGWWAADFRYAEGSVARRLAMLLRCDTQDHETEAAQPAHAGENHEYPVPHNPPIAGGIVADGIWAPPPAEQSTALRLVPRWCKERPGTFQAIDRSAHQKAGKSEPHRGASRVWDRHRGEPKERGH